MLFTSAILLGGKLLADKIRASFPTAPPCDGCGGSLPGDYSYTKCCGTKLCDRCVTLYKVRSPVRCCVCRNPH